MVYILECVEKSKMDYFRNVDSFACRMFWKEGSRGFGR